MTKEVVVHSGKEKGVVVATGDLHGECELRLEIWWCDSDDVEGVLRPGMLGLMKTTKYH